MDLEDEPGQIPDGWTMRRCDAVQFYDSVVVAEVLESMPHAAVVKGIRGWIEGRDLSVTSTWGLPDFYAARVMTNMTRVQMAEALEITEEEMELIEVGILVPTVASLFLMAERLQWPVGAFFRGPLGWHHRTELGRKAGYPCRPLKGERRYPACLTEIVDCLDLLGDDVNE